MSGAIAPPIMITLRQQMASACAGALLTSLLMTPFDVVKTRLQAQQHNSPVHATNCRARVVLNGLLMDQLYFCDVCQLPSNPKHFNGTIDAFVKIRQTEGLVALWRGLPPTLVMAVPATVMYYTLYDKLRPVIGAHVALQHAFIAPLFAGAVARAIAAVVISPLELVRTKMQASHVRYGYNDLYGIISTAVKAEGIQSLWRGIGPTLLRDVPFSGIYWMGYERIRDHLLDIKGSSTTTATTYTQSPLITPIPVAFAAGAISGMIP